MKNNPKQLLAESELIHSAQAITQAIEKLAVEIEKALGQSNPLVMCVMGGAVVFSGQLLPHLAFPLAFDYVQASRYHGETQGTEITWRVQPTENVKGRTILLLDDILDEGHTLAAIREKCLALGALDVKIAVLVEKTLNKQKPVKADFVGLSVPNRYVFGCGMDVYGWWRNLPSIHALKE